jgi:hypothetical protein
MKKIEFLDARTVALVIAIGLAIMVHPAFLLIGSALTIFVLIETVLEAVSSLAYHARPVHRHP